MAFIKEVKSITVSLDGSTLSATGPFPVKVSFNHSFAKEQTIHNPAPLAAVVRKLRERVAELESELAAKTG